MTFRNGSFQNYATIPSAVLADGPVIVPLWAVTTMSKSTTYHLPPIGTTGVRAVTAAHDDTFAISALLLGEERYAWKVALETAAENARRGGVLGAATGGVVSGLIFLSSMNILTDIQITTLSFTATAQRRDTLAVQMSLAHVPRPSALAKLLDLGAVGVGALADFVGD